ncbi:transglycosylase SLT domain-containing protein [bacterium]|nr:transglycosylase SLT domain-containing protein [candidate division CSSED10-310 bacterium]
MMGCRCRFNYIYAAVIFTFIGCTHLDIVYRPDSTEEHAVRDSAEPVELSYSEESADVDVSVRDKNSNDVDLSDSEIDNEITSDNWLDETQQGSNCTSIYRLDIPMNPHIDNCKNYFLNKFQKDYFQGLDRRRRFQTMIQEKIRERGMPESVAWIPMVESWFDPAARSPCHAVGLWQLMPATARKFGLRIDDWIDERKDPIRSTDAALDLLSYLHERTGSWFLAYAAYHCGESGINQAIKRQGIDDYWILSARKEFSSHTRFYVAAIMALTAIERDSERHGVQFPAADQIDDGTIILAKQVDLRWIAGKLGVDVRELRKLNPALKRTWTPPDYPGFTLHIPGDCVDTAIRAEIDQFEREPDWIEHIIQPGDTLSSIAEHYRISIESIMTTNRLTEHLIIAGKKLLIPVF